MNRKLLFLISAICFYSFISFHMFNSIYVHAAEIIEDLDINLDDEIYSNTEEVDPELSDTFKPIKETISEDSDTETDNKDGDNVFNDSEENEEVMTENPIYYMVVFCFGLVLGVIVGNYMTGFIK